MVWITTLPQLPSPPPCHTNPTTFAQTPTDQKSWSASGQAEKAEIYYRYLTANKCTTDLSLEVPGNTRFALLVTTLKRVVHWEDQLHALKEQAFRERNILIGVLGTQHILELVL